MTHGAANTSLESSLTAAQQVDESGRHPDHGRALSGVGRGGSAIGVQRCDGGRRVETGARCGTTATGTALASGARLGMAGR